MSIVSALREVADVLGSEDVRRSIETVGRGVDVAKSALDVIERGVDLGRDVLHDAASLRRDVKPDIRTQNGSSASAASGAAAPGGAPKSTDSPSQDSAQSGPRVTQQAGTAQMSPEELREKLAVRQEESRLRMQFAIHQMHMKQADQLVAFNQDRMEAKRRAMMGNRR